MSLASKGLENNKGNITSISNKVTTLNHNAAEFVPSSLRSANGNKTEDTNRLDSPGSSRKAILDRTHSTTPNNFDDDAHQYWQHQLPDDITPDFTVAEGDVFGPEQLSLAGLSFCNDNEALRYPTSMSKQTLHAVLTNGLTEKLGYSAATFSEDQSTGALINSPADPWNNRVMNTEQHLNDRFEGHHFNGSASAGFMNNLYANPIVEDSVINHVEFLALQFPGFSAERLANIYCANGCDLNMTIEILTQLENQSSKAVPAPSHIALDFPTLPGRNAQNGFLKYNRDNIHRTQNLYRSSASIFRGAPDFASVVRKLESQDNAAWKDKRNNPVEDVGGSSGNSHLLCSPYKGQAKLLYENTLQGFRPAQSPPVWLETGEAVANMYSASRGEARDFAHRQNACFQQAREAYLIGNKALAKALGDKGEWYNLQIKEAHAKARERIYRQRNPLILELQDHGRGQEHMIDLHGLHVNEALHVLKHELGLLRNVVRSGKQCLQVLICMGTGHHTKGTRTPARLPIAVEQYLLDEGLRYSQIQPEREDSKQTLATIDNISAAFLRPTSALRTLEEHCHDFAAAVLSQQ